MIFLPLFVRWINTGSGLMTAVLGNWKHDIRLWCRTDVQHIEKAVASAAFRSCGELWN